MVAKRLLSIMSDTAQISSNGNAGGFHFDHCDEDMSVAVNKNCFHQ
jgi:hypothetical protein